MPEEVNLDFVRELYRNAGLSPSEEELRALVPVVQAFYVGAPQVEALLERDDEPWAAFRLPVQS